MLIFIIIILSISITLLFFWQKNYNEQVYQRLIKETESFIEGIIKSKSLKPISTNIILKDDEIAFLHCNSILKESRNIRYYQSGHTGIRIAKGVYFGKTSGTSQSQAELSSIESGSLTLTNKRLIFNGISNSRKIVLSKLITVYSFRDAISVSSESRQKNMVFTVPNSLIWEFTVKFLVSIKNPLELTNDEVEKIKAVSDDNSQEETNSQPLSINDKSQIPEQNTSIVYKDSDGKYLSNLQDKYIEKRNNLFLRFRFGYDFLKNLENNDQDIWISTAANAHLYLKNNYLAYIVVNDDSLNMRARFNHQICYGTIDKSETMFSNHFRDLIISSDGFSEGWAKEKNEYYIFTSSTPNDFFLSLIDYISNLKLE